MIAEIGGTAMEAVRQAVIKANCALELTRQIVGVKFLFTEEEYEQANAKPLKGRMHYCVMVRKTMSGKELKAAATHFGCPGAARALGITELEERFLSGQHYLGLGLYRDLVTAKHIRNHMTMCRHRAFGVMIKPLEAYAGEPDVVLMVTHPYNAMRIVQGYTYMYGIHAAYKMSGNQAICSECTAYPFESNNINVSMLCGGTRNIARWKDDELGIGIPFNRFIPLIDGVYKTVNAMEPNRNKTKIEAKLNEKGLADLQIEYNKNYFTPYLPLRNNSRRRLS